MQPHTQEYTKQKSIKLYFLLHKHSKIDTTYKKCYFIMKFYMLLHNKNNAPHKVHYFLFFDIVFY